MSNTTANGAHHSHGNGTSGHSNGHPGQNNAGLSTAALTAILFIAGLVGGAVVGGIIYLIVRRIRRDRQRKLGQPPVLAPAAVDFGPAARPPPPPPLPAKDVYGSRLATVGWNDPPPRMVEVKNPRGRMMGQETVSHANASSNYVRGIHKKNGSTSSLATTASGMSAASSSAPLMASNVHAERRQLNRPPGLQTLPERSAPSEASSVRQRNVPSPREPEPKGISNARTVNDGSLSARMRRSGQSHESGPLSPALASSIGHDRSPMPPSRWYASEESLPASRHTSSGQGTLAEMTTMDWPLPPPPIPIPPIPTATLPRTPVLARSRVLPGDVTGGPSGYI